MKVLTLHWLYAAGIFCHLFDPDTYAGPCKTMETRTRRTHIRGTIAIHVAKAQTKQERSLAALYFPTIPHRCGFIIGTVNLVDCLTFERVLAGPVLSAMERKLGFFGPAYFAYALEAPRLLAKPVQATGQLGFWNWQPDVWGLK